MGVHSIERLSYWLPGRSTTALAKRTTVLFLEHMRIGSAGGYCVWRKGGELQG